MGAGSVEWEVSGVWCHLRWATHVCGTAPAAQQGNDDCHRTFDDHCHRTFEWQLVCPPGSMGRRLDGFRPEVVGSVHWAQALLLRIVPTSHAAQLPDRSSAISCNVGGHVFRHVYGWVYRHVYGRVYRHVYRHVHRYAHVYIDMCIGMCMRIRIGTCIGMRIGMCIHMCIDIV